MWCQCGAQCQGCVHVAFLCDQQQTDLTHILHTEKHMPQCQSKFIPIMVTIMPVYTWLISVCDIAESNKRQQYKHTQMHSE